jgi:diadenosine tetraphosphate (Ap4A) HIT family hydrolase
MSGFVLDAKLAADTHEIGEIGLCRALLMDDARFPWLILVPRIAGARELIDLDASDQQALLGEIVRVGRALERMVRPDRLNVAALGNVVAQLHVHVVARHVGDAAWPQPVWGFGTRVPYEGADRDARIAAIRTALAMRSA